MQALDSLPEAILLDRDGVINEDSPAYIKRVEEWLPITGSIEAISRIARNGIPVAICTNQAGLARGKFDQESLCRIHQVLLKRIEDAGGTVKLVRYCPHHPQAHCRCRKPAPGMLLDACRAMKVSPEACWFAGDSVKDLQAARAAGCRSVLVRTGNGKATEASHPSLADAVYDNLSQLANDLLS